MEDPAMTRLTVLAALAAAGLALAATTPDTRLALRPGELGGLFDDSPVPPYPGMVSNSVTQLRVVVEDGDTLVFASNSFGVLRSDDFGASFVTYTDSSGVGRGGVSGLAALPGVVAAATVIDTSIANVQGAGTGIGFSRDRGASWTWLEQPIDSVFDTSIPPQQWIAVDCATGDSLDWLIELPNRTPVENITWSLALEGDSALWAASFAGGFRRLDLATGCWRLFVPDDDRFHPVDHLNHRAFSVLAGRGGIWLGSAGGLNFLPWSVLHDGGEHRLGQGWTHFDYQHPQLDGTPTITGNWVVTMEANPLPDGGEEIWVAGWATYSSVGDYYGLSWTADNGASWTEVEDLRDVKIWDLAFDGDDVYVATDQGLWKSDRHGESGSWSRYPALRDSESGREMITSTVYAVKVVGGRLLVGSTRGLFVSADRGNTWRSTHHEPQAALFFPSPFSPRVHGLATCSVTASRTGSVGIRIYDFAMDLVKTVADGVPLGAGETREFYWDGTTRSGEVAANGVYFYVVEAPGGTRWGKLMVVK
jgi:hypothetical protein